MNEFSMTSRHLYQDLRDAANSMSMAASNPVWVSAFQELRNACDKLDAMYARSEMVAGDE